MTRGSTTQTENERRRFWSDGGFSLMECIVALALLALLMALLPSVIRMSKRASAFAMQITSTTESAMSMRAVERLLAEAMPQIERDDTGALMFAFKGQQHSLSFVAPMIDGPHGAGIWRLTLETEQSPRTGRYEVNLSSSPLAISDGLSGEAYGSADKRTINSGAISFRYFGLATNDTTAQWHNAWMRKDNLPDLVEIKLSNDLRSGVSVAPVVVELMLRQRR